MHIRFYFVRHGETLFNLRGRIQGVCDSPLTEKGIEQAKTASQALRDVWFDRAFTSPSERTMNTAAYILEGRKIEAQIEEGLHEYDFGRFEGTRFTSHPDEVQKMFAEKDFSGVDGESPAKIEVRLRETFRKIVRECEDGDRVLLTSHGFFQTFLMEKMLDVDVEALRASGRNPIPNCGIMVFDYNDGEYSLVSLPQEPGKFKDQHEAKRVTFYYVRHGETLFNQWNRMQGSSDSPLTENGLEQARISAKALKDVEIDRIYTSTSLRARRTAEIIAESHQLEPILCPGLKEVDFGDFEGVVRDSWIEEISRRHLIEHWSDVGGEDMKDIDERIRSTLDAILSRARDGETILLVSHGTFYLNMLRCLFHIDRKQYFEKRMKEGRQAMPNGGIFTFEYADDGFRIRELMVAPDELNQ